MLPRQHPLLLLALLAIPMPVVAERPPIDFSRDVLPILSENCFFCHGPDANHREADLRLDTATGAATVVDHAKPDASELLLRIRSTDPDLQMPPPGSNRQLTPQQVQTLQQWIAGGADWGVHWSFRPIVGPPVPELASRSDIAPVRNAIDAFIQQQLVVEGLLPSPEADRRTLIRRVTLDLTGLPPTPSEVEAFLADESPDAYEKLVDRLLASPAYGERMAWDWLDAARYADTNGYQGDRERTMWPWRDWVIKAFNENLPYDDFTVWQLAGDLLPEATFEQQLATAFCRNHMINGEGGRIAEENRVDYVMDMLETTGTVWLGLTFNCCRCHDHKYDPLTNVDYYAFSAFFNQTPVTGGGGDPFTPPVLLAPTPEQQSELDELQLRLATVQESMKQRNAELAAAQPEWETREREELKVDEVWQPLFLRSVKAEHQQLEVQPGHVVFASGPNPENDTYTIRAAAPIATLSALRLDVLRHPTHTAGGLARSDSGNFVLTELEVLLHRTGSDREERLPIASAEATHEQGGLKVTTAYDGNSRTGWAVYEGKPVDRDHAAVFRLAAPVELNDGDELTIVLHHDSPHKHHNMGRFLLQVSTQADAALAEPQQEFNRALLVDAKDRTAEQRQLVTDRFLKQDAPYQTLVKQQEELQKQREAVQKSVPRVMVMQDMKEPRETFLLDRGLYNERREPVAAQVPASLPPLPEEAPANRLTLARWLVCEEQPLTARVTVNRFWQQVFGVGLVKTAEDFGVQGEVPHHLDLVNWLAADFRDHGWDVKRLMRMFVTSHTYRQSSRTTPELVERDPANRLLARAPRYRLPFWMIRDQALSASGLLVPQHGGPAVNSYQPAGIWEEATFGNKKYSQDRGDSLYRRSLYTFWRRIIAPTMFFDSASRQTCTVKANRTNTPLQSLLTLNDVTYVEAARQLAQLAMTQEAADDGRLAFVYDRILARPVRAAEQQVLLNALQRSRVTFMTEPQAAEDLLKQGESPRDETLNPVEHAAWTALCLAVFNLDETLSRQ